jgi:curved DNA-binding protein CbpA
MPVKEYYAVLELHREATDDEIKRAYRKMAVKWHPDKNPDNQEEACAKFKEISEAYEILIDPEKRRLVDRGVDPNDRSAAAASAASGRTSARYTTRDPFETFNSVFRGRDPFAGFFTDSIFGSTNRTRSGPGASFGSIGRMGSLFNDDDGFGSPFGSLGRMGSLFNDDEGLFGRPTSAGRTVTTTTSIIDGQEVVLKVTEVTAADGTIQKTTETIRGGQGSPTSATSTSTRAATGEPTTTIYVREGSSPQPTQNVRYVIRPTSAGTADAVPSATPTVRYVLRTAAPGASATPTAVRS